MHFNVIHDNIMLASVTHALIHIGAGLYLEGSGLIHNNSIIRTSATGRFNKLQCISGSVVADVGQWIAPNGSNITGQNDDRFVVTVGGISDPGFISIELHDGASLTTSDEGIYTCVIPNESGEEQYLYTGIYRRHFSSKLYEN